MSSSSLTDTSSWLPLDGLAPGFDANKAPHTTDLANRTITLVTETGSRIRHTFAETTVTWAYQPGEGDPIPASEGTDDYEAFLVDEDLYFAQFHHASLPHETVSLTLDLRSGHALSVIADVHDDAEPGATRVTHAFVPATIDGAAISGDAPAPTEALIGRRAHWVYSADHAYEHTYLTPTWYTWQCLAGPERGLADTDEQTTWQIRPGIYVFAWREKVIPCGSVTIADHRDASALRSHGVLFGRDEAGTGYTHFTFGANGRLASVTNYAEALHPGTRA